MLVAFLSQTPPFEGPMPQNGVLADALSEVPPWLSTDPSWEALLDRARGAEPVFPRSLFKFPVTVTAYSSTPDQTDSTPFLTASNRRVRPGIVALSRDLLREYTPGAPFMFGDEVEIRGVGVFTVEDTMNPRYEKRVDIWFTSRNQARQWGRQELCLAAPSNARFENHFDRSVALFAAAHADWTGDTTLR
jgi:3D (Asp-Asp-Asp) domain-containing protein